MMVLAIRGIIRRRILVNFRVDPEVMQRQLPPPFRPKLLGDSAVAGICLIRLEQIHPRVVPLPFGHGGFGSENAAHRVAVIWQDHAGQAREGVYIPRRDSDSLVNQLAGGRLFPGEHRPARFVVRETSEAVDLSMRSRDGATEVRVRAQRANALPATSHFSSVEEASAFFEAGAVGYSPRRDGRQLDGLFLRTPNWSAEPLAVEEVFSSYFADRCSFPSGSVVFDCALLMRNVSSEWQAIPDLCAGEPVVAG